MPTKLLKLLVAFAVAMGLSLTVVGGPSTANAAPAAPATSAGDGVSTAATNCKPQKKKFKKAKKSLKKAKKSFKKAQGKKAKSKAKKRVVKAKKRVKKAKKQLRACKKTSLTPDSPIQALCDAGLPQEICDLIAGLIPGGGSPSLQQFCNAFPAFQRVCDEAEGGADPATLVELLEGLLDTIGLPPGLPRQSAA